MKKKRRLSVQLFITTFIVMTVIIAFIMLLQYLFFDVLYENYKIKKVNSEINELGTKIGNDELDLVELKNIQDEFIFTHNTILTVEDEWGSDYANSLKNKQDWYTVTSTTADHREIVFIISEYDLYYNLQREYGYEINDELIAVGDEFIILFDYIYDNKAKIHMISEYLDIIDDKVDIINSAEIIITEVRSSTQVEIDEYILYDYFFAHNVIEGTVIFEDYAMSNVINIQKLAYTVDGSTVMINALVSLENVDDAAAALLSYYPYFLALAVLCALIISFIYSSKVSKPITNISSISNKMAMLEFDETVEDIGNNEIGQLGENLNILAHNLQIALIELKDANAQLLKDIEQKKEQEKVRKEFVDNVSHELKTPLGVIRCYAESLKDNIITKTKSEYYDDILQEVEKMTRLVMEMLELSKVELGDLKLNKTKVEVKDIIDDNVILHQLLADDKNMKILARGAFPAVVADTQKIDSAISNIIKNSVLYGEKSSNIIVGGEIKDGVCTVSVTNKCKGISRSEAKKFFDRFYVGDKARSESSTGLGLSICAAIFKAHGFDYGILSDGEAVTVWFEYVVEN